MARRLMQKAVVMAVLLHMAVASGVSPDYVSTGLLHGQTHCVKKTVMVPEVANKLDFVLVIDLSGSYRNDLVKIKNKSGALFDGLKAAVSDLRVAVASFVDYPISPYGSCGTSDYAYRLNQDFTADKATFMAAIDAMSTRFGGDGPESQLEALHSLVNGHAGSAACGSNYCGGSHDCSAVTFRADASHVVALTTDYIFHDSDLPGDASYPGAGRAATLASLLANDIVFIGIQAGSSSSLKADLESIALPTGGSVVNTDTASTQIVEAILTGLKEIKFTVKGVPSGCDGLSVSLSPAAHTGVAGGSTVMFEECIKYTGKCIGERTCTVRFLANSDLIGVERNVLDCCQAGEHLVDGKCRPCPAGHKSTDPVSRYCMSCGCGAVANAAHTACMDCPNANQASAADSDVCVTCGPGTFVTADKCGCQRCPIDHFCPGTGSPVPCPFGTYALPGAVECLPIECPEDGADHFDHNSCDEWIVGDLDGANPLPYHGLLLRNLFEHGYFGFTFQNDRTPAVGNEVKAFAVLDYCRDSVFHVHGLAYGGKLDAAGEHPIAGETCKFSMRYDTFVSRTGPGNPGHIRVTDGEGWIDCPSHGLVRLEGKALAGAHLEMMAKYVNEWKANGWLHYPNLDWADPEDRNSTPQDIDFVPLCRLPHTADRIL